MEYLRSVYFTGSCAYETSSALASAFPSVAFVWTRDTRTPRVETDAWDRDFLSFDALASGDTVAIVGDAEVAQRVGAEFLTRHQRRLDRRNSPSRQNVFDRVLALHRRLYASDRPLVRADFHHALDTWQWMLRLAPSASLAAQCAALFHDVERLEGEVDERLELADDDAFQERHARRAAVIAYEAMRSIGIDVETATRVHTIVAGHERRGHDLDVALLHDADALSFFSLSSPDYVDQFGTERAARKAASTYARLGKARRYLEEIKLREDVRAMVAQ